ncbi:MAG TPA: iron ABC transporter permease [Methylomusa anaerophila]|uniref:Putative ABC transporter permease protein n=1 Tax=Methylomusa anaerophila TaxID=1930071 RepID=A0A348AFF8_9FIRM|nr:iron ABC transporter permease [Methylomusa anaerophila]BBB89806.1 putative ABC transporter permease protein [Methylomusa anaerophila]HML89148.1 iron ABC transporter permease [Methylomusa anaerophila]
MPVDDKKAANKKILLLLAALLIMFFLSFALGRHPLAPDVIFTVLISKIIPIKQSWSPEIEVILTQIRLPRIMAAMLVGAALATAGASYQGMFKNPMVSPGILGVTAGASFGAALGILLSFNPVAIQLTAFAFGLLAVLVTYIVAIWFSRRGESILVMILTGVIVGTLFTSFVSLVKYVADPNNTLPAITYWLMGSLAAVTLEDVRMAAFPILSGLAVLYLLRWNLNIMAFGEEEAKALGVNTGRLRLIVIACATLITAAAVSISGVISLVGLIVPHLSRLLMGPNYKFLIPATIMMGSIFLLAVDNLARTLFPVEVPLGILTSIIGAPFFLYLLINTRKGWA